MQIHQFVAELRLIGLDYEGLGRLLNELLTWEAVRVWEIGGRN